MPIIFKLFSSGLAEKLRTSFRVRLFAGITLLILMVSSGFAALLIYQQYQAQTDKRNTEGSLMAKLLARDVRLAVFSGNRDEILLAARRTMTMPDVQSVEIFDRNGALLGRLANPYKDNIRYTVFEDQIPGLLNRQMEENLIVGKKWSGDPESSVGFVKVVVDESRADARLHKTIFMALLATTLFLAFGIMAAFRLAKSMSRPIAQLSACATALKNGDDSVRATIETSDELGDLAYSFNSMIEAIRMRTKDLEEALEELYQLNVALEDKVQKRTAQLESANRELESFNYSASHDLRAPLTRLAGFCDALKEEYGNNLDEQGIYYINRIAATGKQMDMVLSALLTLYQVQQREMAPRNIDLSELVNAVAASFRQREPEREVAFRIQENVIAFCDMKLIWLAIENLLGNAWKFTRGKSDATIEFGSVEQAGDKICYIRDNGAGFDMAYYEKLFQPFQRLHNNDEFPGSGVGLAIVQRIISRHGGKIWLESREGAGTTCYFLLPKGKDTQGAVSKGNAQ
jgi:signal transduction histidine kinase